MFSGCIPILALVFYNGCNNDDNNNVATTIATTIVATSTWALSHRLKKPCHTDGKRHTSFMSKTLYYKTKLPNTLQHTATLCNTTKTSRPTSNQTWLEPPTKVAEQNPSIPEDSND